MLTFDSLAKKYGIGITGGVASGKSSVCELLKKLGYEVIDADFLARRAVAPHSLGLEALVKHFGTSIIAPDSKNLNRKVLRDLIFNDENNRKTVENILHPIIHKLLEKELHKRGLFAVPRVWFYEAALLVEKNSYKKFKQLWVAYCQQETQIKRLVQRDRLSLKEAKLMIAAQLPLNTKLKLADLKINTEENKEKIEKKIREQLKSLISF